MRRRNGADPIHEAVLRRSVPELMQAITSGEDINALDRDGRTALFYAAKDGDIVIVEALIRNGANVDAQDNQLKTSLHFAASEYQVDVARLLLAAEASVDVQDANGNTPLSDAVFESRNRGGMIKLLLSNGADKTLKNKHGVSPEELANTIGNYDARQFLG